MCWPILSILAATDTVFSCILEFLLSCPRLPESEDQNQPAYATALGWVGYTKKYTVFFTVTILAAGLPANYREKNCNTVIKETV